MGIFSFQNLNSITEGGELIAFAGDFQAMKLVYGPDLFTLVEDGLSVVLFDELNSIT